MIDARIRGLWNGDEAPPSEHVRVVASIDGPFLRVATEAPFHGDPAPAMPAGRCSGLWDHEVVELFLVGGAARYLEIELGPHGHYLVLQLAGVRRVVRDDIEIGYTASREGGVWHGQATLPAGLLPDGVERWNAFAIHGTGAGRRYLAAHRLSGSRPDFHRIEDFPRLSG